MTEKRPNITLLVRGKKKVETVSYEDLGNGLVKDANGNRYYLVVNRPDGGYLRGENRKNFTFPRS